MVCKNCGTEINDGAEFCSKCGNRTEVTQTKMTSLTNSSSRLKKIAITFFILVVLGSLLFTLVCMRELNESTSYLTLMFALPGLLSIVFVIGILAKSPKMCIAGSGIGIVGELVTIILMMCFFKDLSLEGKALTEASLKSAIVFVPWILFYALYIVKILKNKVPIIVLIIIAIIAGLSELGALLYVTTGENANVIFLGIVAVIFMLFAVAISLLVIITDKSKTEDFKNDNKCI